MDNQTYTISDTSALSFIPEETNARLISWLDYTRKHANVDEAGPADEESAYNLGAHHMLFDTLDLLNNVEGVPSNKKDHAKRNLVIAMAVGGGIGAYVATGAASYHLRMAKYKVKDRYREWMNRQMQTESFKARCAKTRPVV